jgi:septum formation protein
MSPEIILASASPRRRELLSSLGLSFQVDPADCDETGDASDPTLFVKELAERKATVVQRRHPDSWIIGSDTIVVKNKEILGKPVDKDEAQKMLQMLSGACHEVHTGIALLTPQHRLIRSVCTKVYFKYLNLSTIESYIKSGEPFDKAGGYGIQGFGALLVERIEGDFFSVMGLSLSTLADMFREAGYFIL